MKCQNCGSEIMNGSQFCQVCGAPTLATQASQSMQGGYQQPMQQGYQQPMQQGYRQTYNQQQSVASSEDAGLGLKILSLLIPIVGLILYFVKKDKQPVAAKSCLVWAACGFAINILWPILV